MQAVVMQYEENQDFARYRHLQQPGFILYVRIGSGNQVVKMRGIKPEVTVSHLQEIIHRNTGIAPGRQRLYSAGEYLDPSQTLEDCGIKEECMLSLKCFASVLVSMLDPPGPMLTEIEVDPKNRESVRNLKRKLGVKLGIGVDEQRLYLGPSEMTSFPRRLELDDVSLLSRYLSPSAGNSFLELRPPSKVNAANNIAVRLPLKVEDARDTASPLHNSESAIDAPGAVQGIIYPHMRQTCDTDQWHTIELDMSAIIKRDPLVGDILNLLKDTVKGGRISTILPNPTENSGHMQLQYVGHRVTCGGKKLDESRRSCEDYQMRHSEQLLNAVYDGNYVPEGDSTPSIPKPVPMHPLRDYDTSGTRYTMPRSPTTMPWTIASSEPEDLGAGPRVEIELSAFSYSRNYGSWDVTEHYKTYVEVLVEGTFYVGDNLMAKKERETDTIASSDDQEKRYGVFYQQDAMEVTILGPENDAVAGNRMLNMDPMTWYRKSGKTRASAGKETAIPTLFRDDFPPCFAPHFRFEKRPINMPERPVVIENSDVRARPAFSETIVGHWYVGRERVSDVTAREYTKTNAFNGSCKRGVTISERPYVTVTYEATGDEESSGERRRAYDFRIQAQFYICTKATDFDKGEKPSAKEAFTIQFRQDITKVKRIPHYSDEISAFSSPIGQSMEVTLPVGIANNAWLKTSE